MCISTYRLLEAVVEAHEESGEDVSPAEIAERTDVSTRTLRDPLASLRAYELVALTEEGYRPTVTAYELLELDIDLDSVLILDFGESATRR